MRENVSQNRLHVGKNPLRHWSWTVVEVKIVAGPVNVGAREMDLSVYLEEDDKDYA